MNSQTEGHREDAINRINTLFKATGRPLEAIKGLLKEDSKLYYAWHANIAGAFEDAYVEMSNHRGGEPLTEGDIYIVAHNAAKSFLGLLKGGNNQTGWSC